MFKYHDFLDLLGRKRSLILVNIPFAIAWLVLSRATEVWAIFLSLIILEFSIGVLETIAATFLTEIG